MSKYLIRPHHMLCMQFFEGKGYSDGFVASMAAIKEKLEKEISENTIFKRICDKEEKVGKAQCGVLQLAIAFAYYKKWKKEYK